jgi:hypothetical protein
MILSDVRPACLPGLRGGIDTVCQGSRLNPGTAAPKVLRAAPLQRGPDRPNGWKGLSILPASARTWDASKAELKARRWPMVLSAPARTHHPA